MGIILLLNGRLHAIRLERAKFIKKACKPVSSRLTVRFGLFGFYGPLHLFWFYGAETEACRGDDPTLNSETRQGIFKVRLPKGS